MINYCKYLSSLILPSSVIKLKTTELDKHPIVHSNPLGQKYLDAPIYPVLVEFWNYKNKSWTQFKD